MKKIISILSFLMILSCSKDESDNITLDDSLKLINKNLTIDNAKNVVLSRKIVNDDYFVQLKSIKESKVIKYSKTSESETDSLLPETEIILQNYFRILKIDETIGSLIITQYYINQIESLNISLGVKIETLNKLIFIRDVMLYLDYDTNSADTQSRSWNCAHRDCFDCCMYNKAYDVFERGNWLEQTQFMISAPANTAWWVGQCSWDCW